MTAVPRLAFLGTLLLVGAAHAAGVPLTLSTSGYLLDSADKPLSQPGISLRFSVWKDSLSSDEGNRVWPATGESECIVNVENGFYTAVFDGSLPSGCGAGLTSEFLPPQLPRYLQLSVEGTTLTPRMRIGTVPNAAFAAQSGDAQALITALAASGTLNTATNPVDWSQLKTVPPGFADGTDADTTYTAGSGGGLSLVGNAFSITAGGVTNAMLAGGAVGTAQIADGAITLAKLAALDGKVTGLDADLLDGLDSASLARLDVASTFTNAPSFAPATGAPFTVGSTTRVASLNADLLDDLDSGAFLQTSGAQTATGAKTFQNGASLAVLDGGSLALTEGSLAIANPGTRQGAVRLTDKQIGIEQTTPEGDTRIYADFAPWFSWGIYHENAPNLLHLTRAGTTGIKTWTETGPDGAGGSTTSTTASMVQFDLNNGNATFNGAVTAKYEGFEAYPGATLIVSGWQPVNLNTASFNTLGAALAGNTFTAPKTGFWRCHIGGYSTTPGTGSERYALGFHVARGAGGYALGGFSGGNFSAGDSPLASHIQTFQLNAGDRMQPAMFSSITCSIPAGPNSGHSMRWGCEFAGY